MPILPIVESIAARQPAKRNGGFLITSWVLIGLVCLILLVPSYGFSSWFIAGPILFIPLVLGIIIIASGETLRGLAILIALLIVASLFSVVAPLVYSSLGFSRTTVGSVEEGKGGPQTATSETSSMPLTKTPDQTSQSMAYEHLKAQIQAQSEQLEALKRMRLLIEGGHGYLAGNERLNIEQRHLVQQENVWRERLFNLIGQRTGRSREEVSAIFVNLTQHSAVQLNSTPTNQR